MQRVATDDAWTGASLAIASAILFGAATPLAKLLLGGIEPWLLAGLLYLGAGAGLALLQLGRRVSHVHPAETSLRRADLPWLAGIVLAGGVFGPVLLMLGLRMTTASHAALLLNVEGLATMAMAWLAFRENTDRRLLLGAAAIMAGVALLSWNGGAMALDPHASKWGAVAIMGACAAWGIDNNLTRRLSAVDPVQIAMIKGLAAGSINLGLALVCGAKWPAAGLMLTAGVVGVIGYGLSLILFVLALRHLGTARTSAYFAAAPFIGAIIAVIALGDTVTPQLMVAAALMGVGLYLHLTEHHEHDHEHAAIAHDHAHRHDAHHQHAHEPSIARSEPHAHWHRHAQLRHRHAHYPDLHHRHPHTG